MNSDDELLIAVAARLREELGDVAIDPRRLRAAELVRLLNSTPLGDVISERRFRQHRSRAGFRIGGDRHVDLFRYAAWLLQTRHQQPHQPARDAGGYEVIKERARARNVALSRSGRDIGEIPQPVCLQRKAQAVESLDFYLRTYFPDTFHLPWSKDHLKVIAKIEQAVLEGGLFAVAMPRGSGKTSISEAACLWAVLTGAREFVALVGSNEAQAEEMLDSLKTELETNDLLLEDFPEAVYPIRCLEGIANRCRGQLYRGRRTRIVWTRKTVVLPTIAASPASGAIIRVAGLTGRIRGMKFKRPDGRSARPSLVVVDDPQTDESARSPSQCATRERLLSGAVLGLAGPGKKIAGIMPSTVIRPGDVADRLLDRKKHPEWQGERTKMVYSFPTNEKLWARYAERLAESLRSGRGIQPATEFYRENRQAMDEGAVVAWPQRYNADEISGLQHAMNLRLQDERAFFAEYQNEPLADDPGEEEPLTAEAIARRLGGHARRQVPTASNHLTMFVDVHDKLLYWLVAAWGERFDGQVIDYGTYPDQKRAYFTLRDARVSLAHKRPGAGKEAAILAGLTATVDRLNAQDWIRADGAVMKIGLALIDSGYLPGVIYQAIRTSAHAAVLMPSKGFGVKAANKPFSEYQRHAGDRLGHYWRIPSVRGTRELRTVHIDTNFWKSFLHARLAVPPGDKGALLLFGKRADRHRLLADHLTSEFRVRTEARGHVVDEWQQRPERPDNHWFDCLVGCAVAASMLGCTLPGTQATQGPPRKRIRLSELQQRRRSG